MIYKAPKSQKESGRIGWWTLGGRKGWLKVVGLLKWRLKVAKVWHWRIWGVKEFHIQKRFLFIKLQM